MERLPSSSEPPDPASAPRSAPPRPYKYVPRLTDDEVFPQSRQRLLFGGIAATAVVLLIAGYSLLKRSNAEGYVPEVRFSPVSQWTDDPGLSIAPAFSHDGKLVAYASDRGGAGSLAIWLRPFPSGQARRLTTEAFNDSDPDFSPDGARVVYHSERDGGGIYIAPVTGDSPPRRLTPKGLRPRFSPDGKWIAYYAMTGAAGDSGSAVSRVFILSPDGGEPRQIQPDFVYSRFPVWSPDSQFLLFEGGDTPGWRDWWVTPLEGGAAKATRALQMLNNIAVHAPERWWNGKILFSATEQEHPHLWEMALSSTDWQATGPARQLTNGDAIEQVAAIHKDGRLLFTRMRAAEDVWSLPVDANRGISTGELRQITNGGVNQVPSITADGAKLAYVSNKSGLRDIWVRYPDTSQEESITRFAQVGDRPAISFDGKRLAYPSVAGNGQCSVLVADLERENKISTLPGCFNIWGWSPDGSSLAIYAPKESIRSVDIFRIGAGERRPLLSHSSYSFFDAAFSPDGAWLTFTSGPSAVSSQVYVAPFHGAAIRESEWIPITGEGGHLSAWSPDSSVLYFHSSRDGFQCIWSQKLGPGKRPVGSAQAVQHFHSVAFGTYLMNPRDFHMSVSRDRLVLNLVKETANLWVTAKSK
jgi:Tol biopolymer transport system component